MLGASRALASLGMCGLVCTRCVNHSVSAHVTLGAPDARCVIRHCNTGSLCPCRDVTRMYGQCVFSVLVLCCSTQGGESSPVMSPMTLHTDAAHYLVHSQCSLTQNYFFLPSKMNAVTLASSYQQAHGPCTVLVQGSNTHHSQCIPIPIGWR